MRRRTFLLTGMLGAAGLVWAGGALAQGAPSTLDTVIKRGILIAGLRNDFPPAAYIDEKGDWIGYEIELTQYIADRLGVKLQRELVTSRTRIPMLLNQNIDFIMATMGPESERAKVIDFTLPYIIASNRVLTTTTSGVHSVEDLAAPRRTAMAQGTTDVRLLMALQPKASVIYFQEWPQTVLAVKEGRADAAVTADFTLEALAKGDPKLTIVGPSMVPGGWAIGVRQNDSKWRTFLDEAIGEAWADQTIARLYVKYFGHPPTFTLPVWREYLIPRH